MKIDWDMVKDALDNVVFYVDKNDRQIVYAEYMKPSGAIWFAPIESKDFRSFLRMEYLARAGKDDVLDVNTVLTRIHDHANYDEIYGEIETYNRVAGKLATGVEYYLADKMQRVVRISKGKWRICRKKHFKFLTGSCLAQVEPVHSDKNIRDLLAPYVNLTGDSYLLFIVWLIQCFTCGNHYGLMISAGPGSGKSSMTRLISRLIDPSRSETGFMPKRVEDLQTDLANRYLATYDNNSGITKEFSDTFCSAITGGTVTKRKLYTDNETVCLPLHNTVVINGVSIFPEESDLAERFLFLSLKKLSASKLVSEHDLWIRFEKDKPLILGCIFDTLANASVFAKGLKLTNKPRMADAFKEMVPIAMALGIEEKEFRRILADNTKQMQKVCAEKDIVVAVREYMNGPMRGKQKVSSFSSDLYSKICDNYSGSKNTLPKNASHFSRKLNSETAALKAAGFKVDIDDTGSEGSVMTIRRLKQ